MGKRILIIDDDRIILESLQELFSEAGYSVFVAADGISGFDLIAREKPDLVVADILLPRMHGIALCEKIRASDEFRYIPIILMTGVYKDVNLRMYVHKGLADDFIEKPFKEKDLVAKIEHLLGGGSQKVESQPELPERSERDEHSRKDPADRSLERELDDLIHWARSKPKK
jgi:DNA-binding response OmpR family regulator